MSVSGWGEGGELRHTNYTAARRAVPCLGSILPTGGRGGLIRQVPAACLQRDAGSWDPCSASTQPAVFLYFFGGGNKATGCFPGGVGSEGRRVGLGPGTPSPRSAGRRIPASNRPTLPFHRRPGKDVRLTSSPLSAP